MEAAVSDYLLRPSQQAIVGVAWYLQVWLVVNKPTNMQRPGQPCKASALSLGTLALPLGVRLLALYPAPTSIEATAVSSNWSFWKFPSASVQGKACPQLPLGENM